MGRLVLIMALVLVFWKCDTNEPSSDVAEQLYRHYRAAWSPDGASVAFTGRVNGVLGIYAIDTSGTHLRLIHAGDAVGAAWSPDGQSIAYSELNRIYTVPVSSDAPQLVVQQVNSIRPAWSPDGSKLAYVRDGVRVLTLATMEDVEVSSVGTSPQWRADGVTLLLSLSSTDASAGSLTHTAFLLNTMTREQTEVYSVVSSDYCDFFSMSWDGGFLIYNRKPSALLGEIRRVDLPSRTDLPLVSDAGDYAALSPDGQWVVYTRPTADDGGLWLMRSNGSAKRRLTQP